MEIKVKHKKGKFMCDLGSAILCILLFYWYKITLTKEVSVEFLLNENSKYEKNTSNNWTGPRGLAVKMDSRLIKTTRK